jgi:hypothetical protein
VPDARIKQEKQMGRMKDLGQQLEALRPKKPYTAMKVDDPNKREAYSIPLSTLVNAWRVKFGDLWIDVSELDEEFWLDASSRLHRNKLMEEVEFRESNTPWARLKEDA